MKNKLLAGPYSYKKVGKFQIFSWFWDEYHLMFEDSTIRTFSGTLSELVDIVNLLNTAYNLGFMYGEEGLRREKLFREGL